MLPNFFWKANIDYLDIPANNLIENIKGKSIKKMNRKLRNEELNRLSTNEFKVFPKIPVIIVLDNIRSAYNVGSVFRTADAFLIKGIYLCGFCPFPPNREIQKTALGANETVDWKYFPNILMALGELKNSGYKIVSVEQTLNSIPLNSFIPQKEIPLAIVFGNEVNGISQEVVDASDYCLEVPQFGTKHSLNISVCAGIVLWEIFQKTKK